MIFLPFAQQSRQFSSTVGGVCVLLFLSGLSFTAAYFIEVDNALDGVFGKGKVRISLLPTTCVQCLRGIDIDPIKCPADLDWAGETPSRWRNDFRGEDQGKYFVAFGNVTPFKSKYAFETAVPPKSPFILTGALENQPGRWLVSDTVPLAGPNAVLRFKMWVTPGVFLKVCTKDPNMLQLQSCTAAFVQPPSYSAEEIIPPERVIRLGAPIDKPFELVFWFGGYHHKPGGLGVVDEISYTDSFLCGADPLPLPSGDATISLAPDNTEEAPAPTRKPPIEVPAPTRKPPMKERTKGQGNTRTTKSNKGHRSSVTLAPLTNRRMDQSHS